MKYIEKEVSISEIQTLLNEGYEVQVDSPDEWVDVNYFIDKGMWQEYILEVKGFENVRCNESHLFETKDGWKSAKELCDFESVEILCNDGNFHSGVVYSTENQIPIVDINVNHKNHRYYTNGISSHNTGVGKSLALCHFASANLMSGLNVLYITMEMAEEKISERIDANLLDVSLEELSTLPKSSYEKKINRLKEKTKGKLIVKEYPTACAGSSHFRHLINELKIKKNFIPDIIYIDYLNICMSTRIKQGNGINSYTYIKSIAEELRGLAVECNVPIVSATQVNRSGYSDSDFGLENTSECIWVNEKVNLIDGSSKTICDVVPGDQIISNDGFKTVMFVHHKKPKDCIKIKTKSGKEIIVSKEHIFPSNKGRVSYNTGLAIGTKLNTR